VFKARRPFNNRSIADRLVLKGICVSKRIAYDLIPYCAYGSFAFPKS
jgi:hypothetical protein